MKKSIFLIIWGLSSFVWQVNAQETTNNFTLKDSEVYWQKVFQTSQTFNSILAHFKESGIFQQITTDSSKFYGDIKQFRCFYDELGFSEYTISSFIGSSNFSGFCILEFKNGKYRVTLKKIVVISMNKVEYNPEFMYPIERRILKNNDSQFRELFLKDASKILDYTLMRLFEIKNTVSDSW